MPMYMLRARRDGRVQLLEQARTPRIRCTCTDITCSCSRATAVRSLPWWSDTLEIDAGERYDVAVIAENPGVWMFHCHNLPHAAQGLVTHVAYEGVTTPFRMGKSTRQRAGMKLEVVEGDIAALEVDAVANAANNHLWMGAGVAGALKRAGGEEIEREAVAKGPIPVGDAVATGAGRLPAQVGDPRRGDGSGPADERRARRADDDGACSASRTSSAPSRSRCPPSAPASAAFRSTSAHG